MKYPSKTLIKNISPVARTLSEANRDAQYCTAIQTFKSETKLTLDFAINAVWGALIMLAIASPFVVGLYIWSLL
jgi:hypothetical protein